MKIHTDLGYSKVKILMATVSERGNSLSYVWEFGDPSLLMFLFDKALDQDKRRHG